MKIRKQTYSLEQYLKLMKNETIRTDQECQRLSGQWNAMIATVLTNNYIPPIILGEETVNGITRQWIIDGLQRSSSLSLFRYGNTKNLDEYMITYQRKVLDENGNPKRDAQRAFTYVDTFAREIREITENRFFLDVYTCSRNDRKNGTLERVAGDMVLLCSYPDMYRKETIQGFKWLNENGTIHDFESVNDLLTRLAVSVEGTKEVRTLFNSKHAHIFVAAFKAFTESGLEDKAFREFLEWFMNGGSETEIDGKTWDVLGVDRSTRDAGVVHRKIDHLVSLMERYFEEVRKVA